MRSRKYGRSFRRTSRELDKAIAHGKEKRKPYHGAKAIDGACRNHGSCDWCKNNRKHKFRDKKPPEKGENAE